MASPQKENGYTAIANEIVETILQSGLSASLLYVVLCVLRKTYGFQKKRDAISISQFMQATNLSQRTVVYALQELEAKHIIKIEKHKEGGLNAVNVIAFNKDWEAWDLRASSAQAIKKHGGTARAGRTGGVLHYGVKGTALWGTGVLPHSAQTKENIQKKVTKETPRVPRAKVDPTFSVEGTQIIKAFADLVNPNCARMYGHRVQRAACDDLIKTYGLHRVLEIVAILPKTNAMPFIPTIITPVALREKWSALESGIRKKQGEQVSKGRGFA